MIYQGTMHQSLPPIIPPLLCASSLFLSQCRALTLVFLQLQRLPYLRFSRSFRDGFQYTNYLYGLLSILPPKLVGIPYTEYVKQNILIPAGMTSSTYKYAEAKDSGNLSEGFSKEGKDIDASIDPFYRNGTARVYDFWKKGSAESGELLVPFQLCVEELTMTTTSRGWSWRNNQHTARYGRGIF